jgi:hypothetical protein
LDAPKTLLFEAFQVIPIRLNEPNIHIHEAKSRVSGKRAEVLLEQEVIVSIGLIRTSRLLNLSGIGPSEEFRSLEVEQIVDSPGVYTSTNLWNYTGTWKW